MRNNSVLTSILFLSVIFSAHAADQKTVPFSQNSNAPIDITADQLDVLQNENKAIFTGHVVAIQGDVRLTSEKMVVHYKEQAKKDKKSDGAAAQNSIEKIEVEKDVFLTTPQETASGASGLYDVENKKITLNTNVVLTKDKNTLKGERLVYDFNTGKSTVTSGAEQPNTPWKGKTRVRALFVPENSDTKKE